MAGGEGAGHGGADPAGGSGDQRQRTQLGLGHAASGRSTPDRPPADCGDLAGPRDRAGLRSRRAVASNVSLNSSGPCPRSSPGFLRARVHDLAVADVDADVADRPVEEHEVAGPQVGLGHRLADLRLRPAGAGQRDARPAGRPSRPGRSSRTRWGRRRPSGTGAPTLPSASTQRASRRPRRRGGRRSCRGDGLHGAPARRARRRRAGGRREGWRAAGTGAGARLGTEGRRRPRAVDRSARRRGHGGEQCGRRGGGRHDGGADHRDGVDTGHGGVLGVSTVRPGRPWPTAVQR